MILAQRLRIASRQLVPTSPDRSYLDNRRLWDLLPHTVLGQRNSHCYPRPAPEDPSLYMVNRVIIYLTIYPTYDSVRCPTWDFMSLPGSLLQVRGPAVPHSGRSCERIAKSDLAAEVSRPTLIARCCHYVDENKWT